MCTSMRGRSRVLVHQTRTTPSGVRSVGNGVYAARITGTPAGTTGRERVEAVAPEPPAMRRAANMTAAITLSDPSMVHGTGSGGRRRTILTTGAQVAVVRTFRDLRDANRKAIGTQCFVSLLEPNAASAVGRRGMGVSQD